MRFRRLEFVIIGLTLAFVCFLGGYFTGLKSSVSITTVPSQSVGSVQVSRNDPLSAGAVEAGPAEITGGDKENITADAKPPDADEIHPPEAAGMPKDSDGRININLASRAELMDLPGIGAVLAERIIEYRKLGGVFAKIEDIQKVSGIGVKKFEAIRDRITVG